MARTKFSELGEAVEGRPGSRERLAAKRAETLEEVRLYELRDAEAVSQAELAGRLEVTKGAVQASSERPGPTEWAELAQQAGAVFDQVLRAERDRAARARTPGQWQQPQPWANLAAGRPLPGVSL